jgi:hypothetical protein
MKNEEREREIYKYPMKLWRKFKGFSRNHSEEEMSYKSHTVTAPLPI